MGCVVVQRLYTEFPTWCLVGMSGKSVIWCMEYLGVHGELEARTWCADASELAVRPCKVEFEISEMALRYSNSKVTKIMVTFW